MNKHLKIIFAGTPDFSVPCLAALIHSPHEIKAVYTQPDRPAGRGRKLQQSPIKILALANQLPVFQPRTLKDPSVIQQLTELNADLMVVVAYGLLLPKAVLSIPRLGCINVHASLLPRWRGAAPIQRAIAAGDIETGITIMQMEEGLDTGPMITKAHCDILPTDTAQTLHDRLATLGAETVLKAIAQLSAEQANFVAQNDSVATYASKLTKQEAHIAWNLPAAQIERQIRAYNPWPIAYTLVKDFPLRIWQAEVVLKQTDQQPGVITQISPQGIEVATGDGVIRILKLQLPNGKPMSIHEFYNGHQDLLATGFQFL